VHVGGAAVAETGRGVVVVGCIDLDQSSAGIGDVGVIVAVGKVQVARAGEDARREEGRLAAPRVDVDEIIGALEVSPVGRAP
jgi:hypothetical protein